jgi:hypothetical protein
MMMLVLGHTILLWCVRARYMVKYAMRNQKILKLIRHKFTTTITLKLYNGRRELIFNKRLKLDKNSENIRFIMNEIQPGKPGKIIDKQNIVRIAT